MDDRELLVQLIFMKRINSNAVFVSYPSPREDSMEETLKQYLIGEIKKQNRSLISRHETWQIFTLILTNACLIYFTLFVPVYKEIETNKDHKELIASRTEIATLQDQLASRPSVQYVLTNISPSVFGAPKTTPGSTPFLTNGMNGMTISSQTVTTLVQFNTSMGEHPPTRLGYPGQTPAVNFSNFGTTQEAYPVPLNNTGSISKFQ